MDDDAGRADAERTMARLREALSQPEFEVLLLFSVERLPVNEIAQVVGRSRSGTHSLLRRARAKAREALAADDLREQR